MGNKGKAERQRMLRLLKDAKADLAALLQKRGYAFNEIMMMSGIDSGMLDIAGYTIITQSDTQRNAINADASIVSAVHESLRKAGYPREYVDSVNVGAESEETVARDYDGKWNYYFH